MVTMYDFMVPAIIGRRNRYLSDTLARAHVRAGPGRSNVPFFHCECALAFITSLFPLYYTFLQSLTRSMRNCVQSTRF